MRQPLVFIIGTGRSGTTILQEVLGRQSQIAFPGGEQNWIWHPNLYPFVERRIDGPMYQIDPRRFTEISMQSRTRLQNLRMDLFVKGLRVLNFRRPVLLKSPMLTFMARELYARYENIRFLSIERQPQKVIESWLRKDFETKYDGIYTRDEYRLILSRYIKETRRELNSPFFANLAAQGRYRNIQFEQFIADPVTELRRLAPLFGIDDDLPIPEGVLIDPTK